MGWAASRERFQDLAGRLQGVWGFILFRAYGAQTGREALRGSGMDVVFQDPAGLPKRTFRLLPFATDAAKL